MDVLEAPEVAEGAPDLEHWPPKLESRWYSFKAPWSAKEAAATPEVSQRGSLLRFCDADNIALEQAFSARKDELERCWWEEEAQVQAGPKGSSSSGATASAQPDSATTDAASAPDADNSPSWLDFMVPDTGEQVGVLVRSGSFEVDLCKRQLRPCYWPSSVHRVLRGTWFAEKGGEWVPLREPLADQLEQAFVSKIWAPSKGLLMEASVLGSPEKAPAGSSSSSAPTMAARLDLNTVVDTGLHALFVSDEEMYLMRASPLAWLKRLGASAAAAPTKMRLRRGYAPPPTPAFLQKEADLAAEALDNAAAAAPPNHLLLVVHGIGQTLAKANIAKDALALRACINQVEKDLAAQEESAAIAAAGVESRQMQPGGGAEAAMSAALNTSITTDPVASLSLDANLKPNAPATRGRIEVLPVQWRRTLSLEVDALAAALRPPGIPNLRQVLHSTAVEVLLYLTPLHRAAVLESLVASLNTAFVRFMLRNPEFSGPVSIVAHSLGSVLCWDILCNQSLAGTGASNVPQSLQSQQPSWSAAPVAIPQLSFQVDQLILAGSPLGCFLALRGVDQSKGRGLGTAASSALMQCHPDYAVVPDGLPAVQRLYNIYHPYDPVAYRLEPLAYSSQVINRHRGAFVPLYGAAGKRLHIAAQELGDSVSSAASRLGSTLAGAFSFRRSRSGAAVAGTAAGGEGEDKSGHGGAKRGKKEVEESVDVDMPTVIPEKVSSQQLEGALAEAKRAQGGEAAEAMEVDFGRPDSNPGDMETAQNAENKQESAPVSTIARVAGGELPSAGGWPSSAAGRLDFSLQEASLENQYLSALSAHFIYWNSLDVAQFVVRAVRGLDPIG